MQECDIAYFNTDNVNQFNHTDIMKLIQNQLIPINTDKSASVYRYDTEFQEDEILYVSSN